MSRLGIRRSESQARRGPVADCAFHRAGNPAIRGTDDESDGSQSRIARAPKFLKPGAEAARYAVADEAVRCGETDGIILDRIKCQNADPALVACFPDFAPKNGSNFVPGSFGVSALHAVSIPAFLIIEQLNSVCRSYIALIRENNLC